MKMEGYTEVFLLVPVKVLVHVESGKVSGATSPDLLNLNDLLHKRGAFDTETDAESAAGTLGVVNEDFVNVLRNNYKQFLKKQDEERLTNKHKKNKFAEKRRKSLKPGV